MVFNTAAACCSSKGHEKCEKSLNNAWGEPKKFQGWDCATFEKVFCLIKNEEFKKLNSNLE